ncbi:MAG: hypothetical protein GX846_00085 [Deltaproteobacteria bacterium]|jgi:hypothetical protein|nr:hypothetical protein [Deltaproteobacteria bacterium]
MLLIEKVKETEFLAREFLLWLWYMSEVNGGTYRFEDGDIELWVDKKIVLRRDDDEGTEKITCTGDNLHLKEARFALIEKKQVIESQLRLKVEENEYSFTLDSEWMNLKTLKTPRVKQDIKEDPEGIFYEKMFLIEQAISALDSVYAGFIELRLSPAWDKSVKPALMEWISQFSS